MHFVLAAVIIFGLALGIGIESQTTTNQVASITPCVQPSKNALLGFAKCGLNAPKSPAVLAGLKVGDTVTAFNGVKMTGWQQLHNAILAAKPGQLVSLTVDRDGRSLVLHTRLAEVPGYGTDLGFGANVNTVFTTQSPLGAIRYVGTGFSEVITGSVSALAGLPGAADDLFNKTKRATSAAGNVSSVVGAARDTGQAVAADVGWKEKVSFILLLIASLNIFVGVFNLLPLLPMDGGHVAVVLWEMVRSWWARVRRRPNPGLVDYRKLVPVSFAIFVVLVAFGALLIAADIVNPVNIG
jgi:membrane-associated protease RseP (regulator of RpoE activity)